MITLVTKGRASGSALSMISFGFVGFLATIWRIVRELWPRRRFQQSSLVTFLIEGGFSSSLVSQLTVAGSFLRTISLPTCILNWFAKSSRLVYTIPATMRESVIMMGYLEELEARTWSTELSGFVGRDIQGEILTRGYKR